MKEAEEEEHVLEQAAVAGGELVRVRGVHLSVYALRCMLYALRSTFYVLRSIFYVLPYFSRSSLLLHFFLPF